MNLTELKQKSAPELLELSQELGIEEQFRQYMSSWLAKYEKRLVKLGISI